MAAPAYFAVDWGTSSLRIWAVGDDGSVLGERRSDEGMLAAEDRFRDILGGHLAALGAAGRPRVVLCGMVGARQGWHEAPYVDVPAGLDDIVARALAVPDDSLDAHILPGLARRDPRRPDVMRGEETQLLGTADGGDGLVCMPGTHSKWVTLTGGRVSDFTTVMTGELFAVLARHSILRHSVAGSGANASGGTSGAGASAAFMEGVARALADPAAMVSELFALRAGGLLFDLPADEAHDRLSGLLIGAEIATRTAARAPTGPVTLVASGPLAALYAAGLQAAGAPVRTVEADGAALGGLARAACALWPDIGSRAAGGN